MDRLRLGILAALVATPVLILAGLGAYYLWWTGWAFWAWWPLTGCLALAYVLGWFWQSRQKLLRADFPLPLHWTDRDRQAWQVVEAHAKQAAQSSSEKLTSPAYYLEAGEALALEVAKLYHPGSKDPIGTLTIPEILSVVELASHDLAELVDDFLPGGHLLSIDDLRRIKRIADWYPTVSKISWLVSSVFSPVNTAVRYFAVQAGMNRPWQMLQDNLLVWFFTAYVHRLGNYLIDLNSGRLRVGAQRYRELQRQAAPAESSVNRSDTNAADAVRKVTFAVIGQTKAGKSSLINALLGEQKALTDVLPATAEVQRYELQPPGVHNRFLVLDTVGYGASHVRDDQYRAMEQAARQADIVLLAMHARHPARQSDLAVLADLKRYFDELPDLRKPPLLGVVTHIDLLSPSLEWRPPYDWQHPTYTKEQQIHDAVASVREQTEPQLVGVIPVCTAPGRVYGVQEWLLPALVGLLDQAHAVALLRCLRAEANEGKVRKVAEQLLAVGKGLIQTFWQAASTQRS